MTWVLCVVFLTLCPKAGIAGVSHMADLRLVMGARSVRLKPALS